ncbi:hypothetical protein [Ekhidna sp.]|uniref:NAD(P)H-dependent amine dehydrogenase family protein n=1 Tax=Ekhidna sp. TaxID=2608089 RepID=UPI003CCBA2AD
MHEIKICQVGMGPLGIKIAEFIQSRKGVKTIAAVDKNPELIGKALQDLKENLTSEVIIKESISAVLKDQKPDAVILTTVSSMTGIVPQIKEIIEHGIPVVSTCEELSFPWEANPELAKELNDEAIKHGVAVLGTGVNPGFLMDALPAFLTGICQDVSSVRVSRFQNASFRRVPFQKKIGAGLSIKEFEARKQEGTLRHVGLTESIQLIANALGWKLDKVTDEISPVIAETAYNSNGVSVEKGNARGVCQIGSGYIDGTRKIELVFQATIGEAESYDEVHIEGSPTIKSRISDGVNGDIATCAITINAVRSLLKSSPGLRTMSDIPMVSFTE